MRLCSDVAVAYVTVTVQAFTDVWQNDRLLNIVEQIVGRDVACHPVWNLRVKTPHNPLTDVPWHQGHVTRSSGYILVNPLEFRGSYSVTSNNLKLVHWPLMDGLLHLVQRAGDWAGPQTAHSPRCCTKCNSPSINSQCTNHRIAV